MEEATVVAVSLPCVDPPWWGGSIPGHQVHFLDHVGAFRELCQRYFDTNLMFDGATFHRG
jgi:hypothetical protein